MAGDGPIHTIPAPNLSLQDAQPIPEITIQNVNNHLDADFPKFDSQGKPSERPVSSILSISLLSNYLICIFGKHYIKLNKALIKNDFITFMILHILKENIHCLMRYMTCLFCIWI